MEMKHKIVLMPDHVFRKYWNILMITLLGYVATWVPYSICFKETNPDGPITGEEIVDYIVDILFIIDIFINFISSYDDPVTSLPVISMKKISINYM